MDELLLFLRDTAVEALYIGVFAALLTGYLCDFFLLRKRLVYPILAGYCVLAAAADRLTAALCGNTQVHSLVYILMIFVLPYFGFYFLTTLPLPKYLYCLGSVSIQVFFIVGILEFFRVSQDSLLTYSLPQAACVLLPLAVLDALIIGVFRRFAAPLFLNSRSISDWKRLMIPPISGAAALGVFYFRTDFSSAGANTLLIFCVCYLALFVADIAAMGSIAVSVRATVAETKLESARLILDSQKEQYRRLSDSIAQTRQARHDLRHHMNAISAFLDANDLDGLRGYLAEYGQRMPAAEDYLYTGNYAADIIVGHYLSIAKQNGIRVDFSLHIPESGYIRDTDLCVLMGNCLENAIAACMKLDPKDRFLRVESAVKKKYLAVTVANSCDGRAVMRDGVYMSEKRQNRTAGVGLESMKAIVRSYSGEMKLEEKDGVFTTYIMLKMLDK